MPVVLIFSVYPKYILNIFPFVIQFVIFDVSKFKFIKIQIKIFIRDLLKKSEQF